MIKKALLIAAAVGQMALGMTAVQAMATVDDSVPQEKERLLLSDYKLATERMPEQTPYFNAGRAFFNPVVYQGRVVMLADGTHLDLRQYPEVSLFDAGIFADPDNYVVADSLIKTALSKTPEYATLASFNGKILTEAGLYQLKGEDSHARHTAYVLQMGITKEAYKLLAESANIEGVEHLTEESLFSQAMQEYEEIETLGLAAYNQKINEKLQAQLAKAVTNQQALLAGSVSTEESKEMAKFMQDYFKTIVFTVRHFQKGHSNFIGNDAVQPLTLRALYEVDGFMVPASSFAWIKKDKESLLFTTILMNDASYDFWLPRIENMTGYYLKGGK